MKQIQCKVKWQCSPLTWLFFAHAFSWKYGNIIESKFDVQSLDRDLGCVYAQFAKAESAFWNADSKRRSRGCCLCSLFSCSRKSWFREHALRMRLLCWPKKAGQIGVRAFSEILNSGYCLFMHVSTARELELESIIAHCAIFARAGPGRTHFQVNRKGVYMTSFKWDYMWVAFMLPQNQRFALITIVNAPFCAFWNGIYKKMSPDATMFCTNHVWKRWFWPQKVEHKRTLRMSPVDCF